MLEYVDRLICKRRLTCGLNRALLRILPFTIMAAINLRVREEVKKRTSKIEALSQYMYALKQQSRNKSKTDNWENNQPAKERSRLSFKVPPLFSLVGIYIIAYLVLVQETVLDRFLRIIGSQAGINKLHLSRA